MPKKLAIGRYNRVTYPACNTMAYRELWAKKCERLAKILRNPAIQMGVKSDFPAGDPNTTVFWVQAIGDNGLDFTAFGAINVAQKDGDL